MTNIASYIDHTILKPTTSHIEIKKICEEAVQYGFAAVCVPPPYVIEARKLLPLTPGSPAGQSVKVATVIGFPFGYSIRKAKLEETEQAIADGADELDVVINLIALKNGLWDYLEKEMNTLSDCIHAHNRLVKVIIESGVLTDEEIIRCCALYSKVGVDFVKTSTGYAEKGATIGAVQLMRKQLPPSIRIKASGGIRQYTFARQLIEAGADRLGCSGSVEIVKEEAAGKNPEPNGKKRSKSANGDWDVGGEG